MTGSAVRATPAGEQGGIPLEAALLAPVLITLLLFAVAAGRYETSKAFLNAAAQAAARSASLSRTPAEAQTRGQAAAKLVLAGQGVPCVPTVQLDTTMLDKAPGVSGYVAATVTCRLNLKDLSLVPGLTSTVDMQSVFVSTIDTYRAKG